MVSLRSNQSGGQVCGLILSLARHSAAVPSAYSVCQSQLACQMLTHNCAFLSTNLLNGTRNTNSKLEPFKHLSSCLKVSKRVQGKLGLGHTGHELLGPGAQLSGAQFAKNHKKIFYISRRVNDPPILQVL